MIDNTKWSEIYNKHSKKMLWVCKRYVNDISLAEDLMHEGFIVAMQKQNTFSGFGSFEGWLRTIMVNTSLMYLRKNKSSLFVSDVDISDNTPAITDMNLNNDSKSKIINTDFSQQELLDVVEAIPEHHKLVFNMYVIDKFSHNEISKTLNITTNTSKSHLLRARKKIQELLLLKANEKEQKKDGKKLFFWLLFTSGYIDSMYSKGFSSFQESPLRSFDIDAVARQQNLPDKITSGYIFGITIQKWLIATVSMIVILFAFFYFLDQGSKADEKVTETKVSNQKSQNDKANLKPLQKDNSEIDKAEETSKNNQDYSINQSGKKESGSDDTKKAIEKHPKKTHKKNEGKQPVVIKKIIDTVYVYK